MEDDTEFYSRSRIGSMLLEIEEIAIAIERGAKDPIQFGVWICVP